MKKINTDSAKIFGTNVQRRRKILGMTQEELAERLDIGQQSLSRIERGTMSPKFERLAAFADLLHCTVAELFLCEKNSIGDMENMIANILQDANAEEKCSILDFVSHAVSMFRKHRQ